MLSDRLKMRSTNARNKQTLEHACVALDKLTKSYRMLHDTMALWRASYKRRRASLMLSVQPWILHFVFLNNPLPRSTCSVSRTGNPLMSGSKPMIPPVFWSWNSSQRLRFASSAALSRASRDYCKQIYTYIYIYIYIYTHTYTYTCISLSLSLSIYIYIYIYILYVSR